MDSLIRKRANGAFTDLVRAALEKEQQRRAKNVPLEWKLTGEAFLREALAIAHSTPERLMELREGLKKGPAFERANQALRNITKRVRNPTSTSPPTKLKNIGDLIGDDVRSELSALRSNPFELFALGVLIAVEEHPDSFGSNSGDAERRFQEVTAQRDALNAKIGTDYGPEDIEFSDVDAAGRARVTFKISGGKVPIYPKENAGERLVAWLIAEGRTP